MAGDADLFNAMKKMEKRRKLMERKAEQKEKNQEKRKENWGVFGFLNNRLKDEGEWWGVLLIIGLDSLIGVES